MSQYHNSEVEENEDDQPNDEEVQEIKRKVSIINKGFLVDVVDVEENANSGDKMVTVKVKSMVEVGGCPFFANIKLKGPFQVL